MKSQVWRAMESSCQHVRVIDFWDCVFDPGGTGDAAGFGAGGGNSETDGSGAGEKRQRAGHEDRSERGRAHPGRSTNGPKPAQVHTAHAHIQNKSSTSNGVAG